MESFKKTIISCVKDICGMRAIKRQEWGSLKENKMSFPRKMNKTRRWVEK